ncbi:MAG: AIPR family protein [Elainellaceae cyanobacterium]
MSNNDVIVLDSILEQKRKDSAESINSSEYFELFSFEQVLKDNDLSYDELLSGKVDGGDDGGIDGFFMFINKDLIDEDFDLEGIKKNPVFEIFMIQSKVSSSFKEKPIETLISTAHDIFNLSKNIEKVQEIYNALLVEKVNTFRKAYVELANRHPRLRIKYVYASKGNAKELNQKIHSKVNTLRQIIEEYLVGAEFSFDFIGARELLAVSRQEKSYSLQLKFLENYISRGENNYVVLSSLKDYYDFISDEMGNLRKYIFESNVRDYQGDVAVNKDIRKTLEHHDRSNIDFWWLNNGITIIASKASIAGKVITLDDVQIVNGLQTTNTIYEYVDSTPIQSNSTPSDSFKSVQENRAVLIKIIVVESDSETRDRIIKATNFQTPVPAASLRATEPIQRDIEDYFLKNGWFYDRRKNYYKNIGKPSERIVSIPYLAQAFTAMVFREPHNSKGKPTSLTKGEFNYSRVFNDSVDIRLYLYCSKTLKTIEKFIRSDEFSQLREQHSNELLSSVTLRSLIFHLAMFMTIKTLGKKTYMMEDFDRVIGEEPDFPLIGQAVINIIEFTSEYLTTDSTLSLNTVVKREDFVKYLLDKITV